MTPDQAVREAAKGDLRPLYLVVGAEAFLARKVRLALRDAALANGVADLNHDRFVASDTSGEDVVAAARMLPMMARTRFVELTGVDKWEGKSERGATSLDALAAYAADPNPSTVMVIAAGKLNGSRKLVKAAKKGGFFVACESPPRRELAGWIVRAAKSRGHELSRAAAEALAELVGPELGPVADAVERLSLYVGSGNPIDEEALVDVVTRTRQQDVWSLVDALARQQLGHALEALDDVFETPGSGLPLLGAIAWRVRQLVKFQGALASGLDPKRAAKAAGVAPFKAAETERTVKAVGGAKLASWLLLLAEADSALKGSRRRGERVLETLMLSMCS